MECGRSAADERYAVGCAHAQQMIWQLFNAVEKGFNAAGDTDTAFLAGGTPFRFDGGLYVLIFS